MSRRRTPLRAGSLVLDNEGVARAATDRAIYARLKVAHADGRRVVTSAGVVTELIRGHQRDAGLYRVLRRVAVEPVTQDLAEQAGKLIGQARLESEQAVDAMVAATAVAEPRPTVIVTSDIPHLSALVAGRDGIVVKHVERLGNA